MFWPYLDAPWDVSAWHCNQPEGNLGEPASIAQRKNQTGTWSTNAWQNMWFSYTYDRPQSTMDAEL